MSGMFGYSREAVRVKVKKCEANLPPEWRKFSVDPQITSLEVLYSILAKAFDLKTDFGISYKTLDQSGQEIYVAVLSDWDLDAAFLRAHNLSISTATEPCLNLRVDIKPFSEATDWENGFSNSSHTPRETAFHQSFGAGQRYVQTVQNRLPGIIMNQMEKTFSMVQRAFNFVDEQSIMQSPRPPLTDTEFRGFLDSVGQIVHPHDLRKVIYVGGIDPSLRRVVWKHILNVYPDGMTGRERMDYMKKKAAEYYKLRDVWRAAVQKGSVAGELAYVTSMVRKDVLRTDRLHPFYAGSDDNQNIASLFNILTTYALNHPAVSYCQGMSDIASPLLVTMSDEAQAYICFCAVMRRLCSNFMLDGIAMTKKFTHLSEALQHYDPEFYEYLKSQQADDLLFCYRWLLLEMKREFAFEDSLRMLEVLWSSLPSDPPAKELILFEKEFEPPLDVPPPKSPSVILRTPRENPYTKICALRRQSSALSLLSQSSTVGVSSSVPESTTIGKLDATKRLNQSLDENITRDRNVGITKIHQSLDETKLLLALKQQQQNNGPIIPTTNSCTESKELEIELKETPKVIETNKKSNENNISTNLIKLSSSSILEATSEAEEFRSERPRSVSPIEMRTLNESNASETSDSDITYQNKAHQLNNKALFSHSTGNLLHRQLSGKKGGHFKDLKERIAASKKGIFASLEGMQSDGIICDPKTSKGQKVVKNFNEFLNFASINKSRISDKLSAKRLDNLANEEKSEKPLIKLTKSSFDDSDSSSIIENSVIDTAAATKPLQLQLSSTLMEKQISLDGSSPDDSQDYFPMTTSMTRELRLELENLDRQVFGPDFQKKQFNALTDCDTPESGDSVTSIERNKSPGKSSSEVAYKKLSQTSMDIYEVENDDQSTEICKCPADKVFNGYKVRNKNTRVDNQEELVMKRISTCSANNDVFIWENPLHQFSPCSGTIDIVTVDDEILNSLQDLNLTTPDEQADLEYDGEIVDETHLGKKSVTPIRLVRKIGDRRSRIGSSSNRSSMITITNNESDSEKSDSWNENNTTTQASKLQYPMASNVVAQILDEKDLLVHQQLNQMTNSCEEASEANITLTRVAGALPHPTEFGGGNPFLMFLCLTLLLQHRDFVMKSGMDYNEMAMHFDKMVRKHNVIRVLNQARRMYAEYLKSQNYNTVVGVSIARGGRMDVNT